MTTQTQLAELAEPLDASRRDLALLLMTTERSVHRWEAGGACTSLFAAGVISCLYTKWKTMPQHEWVQFQETFMRLLRTQGPFTAVSYLFLDCIPKDARQGLWGVEL